MATLKQFQKLGKLEQAVRDEKDPKKAKKLRGEADRLRAKLQPKK